MDSSQLVPLLIGAISSLTFAIGVLWRQAVMESRRKDELIDRLLVAAVRAADATERTVALSEKRQRGRDTP